MPGSFVTRRQFTLGLMAAGGSLLVSRRAPAADFQLRQFHNQPPESPLHQRLLEMWSAVKAETNGRIDVQTFPENNHIAGGDPAALQMIVDGRLDFMTLNGGLIGAIVPGDECAKHPLCISRYHRRYSRLWMAISAITCGRR